MPFTLLKNLTLQFARPSLDFGKHNIFVAYFLNGFLFELSSYFRIQKMTANDKFVVTIGKEKFLYVLRIWDPPKISGIVKIMWYGMGDCMVEEGSVQCSEYLASLILLLRASSGVSGGSGIADTTAQP
jgi:hypothetical protein